MFLLPWHGSFASKGHSAFGCNPRRTPADLFINSASRERAAMALSKLSGDEAGIVFSQLCNVLEPRTAVYLSSASNELWTATQALLPLRLGRCPQLIAGAARARCTAG